VPAGVVSDAQRARVDDYVKRAKAANTRASYEKDWELWEKWCADNDHSPMPADPLVVAVYLTELHQERGLSPATCDRRLRGIGFAHTEAGMESPSKNPGVRTALEGIKRVASAEGYVPKQARALSVDELRALVADMPATLAGKRDRTLLLVGYALGLRASNIVGLDVAHLSPTADGLDVLIARSKTDQTGVGRTVALRRGVREATCPVLALQVWLDAAGITEGPVFRSVGKGRTPRLGAGRMTTRAVDFILDRAALRTGISRDRLSPHSLRSGFVTTGYDNDTPEQEIADTGGWVSLPTQRKYNRRKRWKDPASGRLGL
jgi:integrase